MTPRPLPVEKEDYAGTTQKKNSGTPRQFSSDREKSAEKVTLEICQKRRKTGKVPAGDDGGSCCPSERGGTRYRGRGDEVEKRGETGSCARGKDEPTPKIQAPGVWSTFKKNLGGSSMGGESPRYLKPSPKLNRGSFQVSGGGNARTRLRSFLNAKLMEEKEKLRRV